VTGLRLSRIFWIGAAAILIAAALVALESVIRGDFSENDGRILATLTAALLGGATLVSGLAAVDRGRPALGWATVAVSVPGFALIVYAIWNIMFENDGNLWSWGWTGALTLVAALMATTAQLLARSQQLARLAWVAGGLAASASAVTIGVAWSDGSSETLGKAIAALWILAWLAYLLVPVLQRFTSAGVAAERVVAAIDGVELVATRAREGTFEAKLEPGERLLLRRTG
jgi:hypothetical protein